MTNPDYSRKVSFFGRYSKLVAAAVAAVAYVLADNVFDVNDGIQVVLAVLGAAGVYLAPANKPNVEPTARSNYPDYRL